MKLYMKKFAGYWYSFVVIALLVAFFTGTLEQCLYTGGWSKAPLCAKIGIPIVFVTFIGFWILMLEDLFENETIKYRILIALGMFFLHWIAILVYFWLVVFRRKQGS